MFKIEKSLDLNFYWITCKECFTFDYETAEYLDLTLEEYQNILKKHNGFVAENGGIYFSLIEYAQQVIEELEPRLIMIELIGE